MLGNIRTLVLSWNQISSVEGLDRMYSLERLAIDHNNIQYLQDAAGLANLPDLMHLEMKGNPIETNGKDWSSYSILYWHLYYFLSTLDNSLHLCFSLSLSLMCRFTLSSEPFESLQGASLEAFAEGSYLSAIAGASPSS